MAAAKGKTTGKKAATRKKAPQERGVWREVIGIMLFFTGVILIYLLATEPRDGMGAQAVWLCRALAGGLSYMVGVAFCWIGIVVAFSGREKSISPGRVFLMATLAVLIMTLIHLFSAADIMRQASLYDYQTFLERSRDYQTGGAGLIGALLCWPLYRNLTAAGAAITIVALILVNLILQRKISLRKIGSKAQEKFDDFKEQQIARAARRMEEREARARERAAVIPRVAPRVDDEDDPFAKYLGDDAPSRRRKREQRIEKIKADTPLPGEPKVTPKPPDDLIDDIPDFLSGRRKKIRAEKINIAEPRPLKETMDEALFPMPDGSEIAETP
ncbi:MAG: hypothetical protein Q4D04_11220, partial [Clostridia bacterium]|nr:hypothetical protein [Clostridia bacterium]